MTPVESVAAYENFCGNNKGFELTWKNSGTIKKQTAHFPATISNKVEEILPDSDPNFTVSITRVDLTPTFEGYKEWLSFQV